jgi:DNA-binding HxlR family transcriptional regulator
VAKQSSAASRQPSAASRQPAVVDRPADDARAAKRSPLQLDRLIHERLRLGIVSALAVNERLSFNDLKRLLHTTDGNLSVHARKLEEAQYVACDKTFAGRVPRTEYRLTASGRRALDKYLAHMEAIIKAVKN